MNKNCGVLFDLDGVFYISNQAIDGGQKAINLLRKNDIPIRFLTNTTTKPRNVICDKLHKLGLEVYKNEIFSASYIGINYLRSIGSPPCHLLIHENIYSGYAEFEMKNNKPEYVVIGDRGHEWNYDDMNQAFNFLKEGAKLIALHKGRFFQTSDSLEIDIGAFVAGLEYSSGKQAVSLGKPNPHFFQVALDDMSRKSEEVFMVGDDIVNDIWGAKNLGIKGVLVRTGKYRNSDLFHPDIKPDFIIDSVNNLEAVFQ